MKIIFYITTIILLTALLSACFNSTQAPIIAHKVTFEHKGSKTGKNENNTLFEFSLKIHKQQDVHDIAFYMDVVSVYCGEDICKIDPVRLHWDRFGFYRKYSLKKGVKLEKAFGEDFTANDYDKLDKILKNKRSGLASLHKDELVQSLPSGNTVDALSGATITILKDDYVAGAIWTCYTLWHFANGDITRIIRDITGNSMSIEVLNMFIQTGNLNEKHFAIEQLQQKKAFDQMSINNILQLVSNQSASNQPNITTNQAVMNYVNTLPDAQYFNAINALINMDSNEIKLLSLQSLMASSLVAPTNYYDKLSEQVPKMALYQEVDLFLTLVNTKQVSSKQILANLSQLLSHKRFSVARRVYWFLSKQPINQEIQQALELFYQKNNGKL